MRTWEIDSGIGIYLPVSPQDHSNIGMMLRSSWCNDSDAMKIAIRLSNRYLLMM
ncbi:MAG: hypothetical protein PHI32_08720 [Dysgonamonadaceae bacterium]|nr:hypothetical protein [Dysgonamonadaceae bacterium]